MLKKFIALNLSFMVLICTLCSCSTPFISDYEKANQLFNEGKYKEARELYLADVEHEDSPEKAKECAYRIITSYLDNNLGGWDEYSGSYTQDDGDFTTYTVRVESRGNGKIELIYATDFSDSYNIVGNNFKMSTDIATTVTLDPTSDMAECHYDAEINLNSSVDNYESRGKLDISKITKNDIGDLTNVSGHIGQPKNFESGISRSIEKLSAFLDKRNLGITMSDLGFDNYN